MIRDIRINGRSLRNDYEITNDGSGFWFIKHNGEEYTLEQMNGWWWLNGGIQIAAARTDTFKALARALDKIRGDELRAEFDAIPRIEETEQ